MTRERMKPDALLKRANAEEQQKKRGSLKIYLGAAPGVGKTYTMLQDARQKLEQGLDIVVGIVESHGRKDIEKLLEGLEQIPLQLVDYKGKTFTEFDLDAALRRNPGLILIDEMAHSNIGGLRHTKRWQDIKELLDRGVDVYTTLNVQHIESLNNDVAGIIHAPIQETVPDSMIEMADTIELVDLPPEELLNRLQAGKVYFPTQAALAKDKFFKKGNLIALRELALRVTAARVGAQVLLYRQGQGIQHIWSSSEKILVCVGPDPASLKLIRTARRLATSLQTEWLAVYVDSPRVRVTAEERNQAVKNLRLAEQLGAETRVISGFDIVKEIMSCAREENCTLIMIWKQVRSRWYEFWRKSLADEVVRQSAEINVYIITGEIGESNKYDGLVARKKAIRNMYLLSIIVVIGATLLNMAIFKYVSQKNLILVYLVAVTIISMFGRIGPSLFASILSVVAYVGFFFPSLFTFALPNLEYLSALVILIVLTQVISYLTVLARKQANAARIAEKQASDLHTLSHKLASTRGTTNLLNIGAQYIADVFDSEIMILMPESGALAVVTSVSTVKSLDEKEYAVAQWVYELGQKAGLGTDTLPMSDAMYVPLIASEGTVGVIRIFPNHPEVLFAPEQMNFMATCVNQLALAIEVDYLQERQKQSELEEQVEKARQILLKSVTQELRAPLASIMLTATTQIQLAKDLDANKIIDLGQSIYADTEQLNILINNLLQINYLEFGELHVNKKPESLRHIVTKILEQIRAKLGKRQVYIKISSDIPNVPVDRKLLIDILNNLLDNAVKFSPEDQPIEIAANVGTDKIVMSVADHGPGIDETDITKIFDKFYRGDKIVTQYRGLGLGLTICKILVEAHGGKIWVENRQEGGTIVKFTMPLEVPGNNLPAD